MIRAGSAKIAAMQATGKAYLRIGEVANLVGVEPHVLRYWEREFRTIKPSKSPHGQRVYSRRDVERLVRVRELLYTEGFTIAGAKKQLQHVPTAAHRGELPSDACESSPHDAAMTESAHSRAPLMATVARTAGLAKSAETAARTSNPENSTADLEVAPCGANQAFASSMRRELCSMREEIEAFLCDLST